MGRVRAVLVRPWVVGVLVVAVAAVGLGSYWFQPWKLWQDQTVTEALPGAVETSAVSEPERAGATSPTGSPTPSAPAPAGPETLADGELISHEHTTSGAVKLVRLADGSHVVRLENLDTSNGPDLRVWLTDAPVKEGRAGWHVFDDGKYVSLGRLKGNKGSQNYPLPADVDPAGFSSVSIWCDRFDVSFGAAELTRV
ncbi:DM13 domain-containing protein [Streptomyces sp. ATCC 21386]|uniref:DM13 domain-containing protein n=1 Tax=Streptomyces sp. ATCC 21386 TaxID=2699428 RepID=UPI001BFF6172|nr:DM13 domain-containing protein [Streptomyces sp. ATCC 21386]